MPRTPAGHAGSPGPLWLGEQELLEAAARGDQFRPSTPIRAGILRALCIGINSKWTIDPKGILILAGTIEGALDLSSVSIKVPLQFRACTFEETIQLYGAQTKSLIFSGCSVPSITGDDLVVDGSILLDSGFKANKGVHLRRARVAGELDCHAGTMGAADGYALDAQDLVTGGAVSLDAGFAAYGGVDVSGAQIGQRLCCDGALLNAADWSDEGRAFTGDGLSTRGTASFRDMTSRGQVRLLAADIGGDVDFTGAQLHAPASYSGGGDWCALSAEKVKTAGSVHFTKSFKAWGEVRLNSAKIGSQLICRGASFKNPAADGKAFVAEFTTVKGALVWDQMSDRPEGQVDFLQASAASLLDDKDSWPSPGKFVLTGFVYRSIAQKAPSDPATRLEWLRLQGDSFSPQPYVQLEQYYRSLGQQESGTKIAIEREREIRRREPRNWLTDLWNAYLDRAVAYGYRSGRVVVLLSALLLASSLVAYTAQQSGAMLATKPPAGSTPRAVECNRVYPCFAPVAYAAEQTIPALNLHQAESWTPDASTTIGFLARIWGWLAVVLGWVLTATFLAGVTGLVKKG